jgi:hypothetical protein
MLARVAIVSFGVAVSFGALVVGETFVTHRLARADDSLSGQWSATAMTATWKIGDWGPACGPQPTGTGAPSGVVSVVEQGGELTLMGAGRNYTTRECREQYPGLRVTSHSAGGRTWRNTCRTAPGDPRQAQLVTTVTGSSTQIAFDETGQYQFVIKGQNCTASVRRTRFLRPLSSTGSAPQPAPAASAATSKSEQTAACRTPGPPARLEVRPSRKLMRPGESFSFRALVMDARGCSVGASPSFRIAGATSGISVSGAGRVEVPEATPEGEVKVIASAGGRSVTVAVEVVSRTRYDALLAEGRFDESGASQEAAVVKLESSSIGAKETVLKDESERQRTLFVALVGGAALVLGLFGLALVLRSRRSSRSGPDSVPSSSRPATTPRIAPASPGTVVCPTCRNEFPAGVQFCPKDGNRLTSLASNAPIGPSGAVCPVCGQGYDPGVAVCPKHDEPLVPAGLYASNQRGSPSKIRKICPMCGAQFPGDSEFCGTCGAALVQVN